MTEATHQMASNPLSPRIRKAGSVGHPTGIEIAILDAVGTSLAAETRGEVSIKGPT
jgi:acyl-coenzyme A synthetase/AMP-(fatty) acid ligase